MRKSIVSSTLAYLIPLGIIFAGIFWGGIKAEKLRQYKPVTGEVIELTRTVKNTGDIGPYDTLGSPVYYPKILYYDEHNEPHIFQPKIGTNRPPRMGEKVSLLVNPRNPDEVIINSFVYKWLSPVLICIIGFIMLIFAIIIKKKIIKGGE